MLRIELIGFGSLLVNNARGYRFKSVDWWVSTEAAYAVCKRGCTIGLLKSGAPPVCRVPGCHQPVCLTGAVPSGCGTCHPSGSGAGGRW